jgi:hypothetical protein
MVRKRPAEDEPGYTPTPLEELPSSEVTPVLPVAAPVEDTVTLVAAPPAPKVSTLPYVPLDVFCATSGLRPDQTRGFARWARAQGIRIMQIPEWREQFQKFQTRAVS